MNRPTHIVAWFTQVCSDSTEALVTYLEHEIEGCLCCPSDAGEAGLGGDVTQRRLTGLRDEYASSTLRESIWYTDEGRSRVEQPTEHVDVVLNSIACVQFGQQPSAVIGESIMDAVRGGDRIAHVTSDVSE